MNNDEWLDRQLRDAVPYIDDAGFTAGVLKKLPPPRPRREWSRAIIMIAMTLLASTIAYFLSDGGRFIAVTIERIAILPLMWIYALALGSGLLLTGLGLAAAVNKTREQGSSVL